MDPSPPLRTVTVRELSRSPGRVLERVTRGERLIVCSNGRPVATLQPLNGVVVQPFEPSQHDPTGSPLSDAAGEVAKLSELERELLHSAILIDRLVPVRLCGKHQLLDVQAAVDGLIQRGLATKSHRGTLVTGRGLVLHEHLAATLGGSREVKS